MCPNPASYGLRCYRRGVTPTSFDLYCTPSPSPQTNTHTHTQHVSRSTHKHTRTRMRAHTHTHTHTHRDKQRMPTKGSDAAGAVSSHRLLFLAIPIPSGPFDSTTPSAFPRGVAAGGGCCACCATLPVTLEIEK